LCSYGCTYICIYACEHINNYLPTLGETIFLGLLPPISGRLVFGVPSLSEADTADTSARFVKDDPAADIDCTLRMLAASALRVCMNVQNECKYACVQVLVHVRL
jgi:hypothetical protein